MESAVVLAGFALISLVIIYVVIASSSLQISQQSRIFENQVRGDLKNLFDTARGMYRIGWSSYDKTVPLSNSYDIYITENSITLSIYGRNYSEAGPVPLVPKNLTGVSSVNLSYVVYAGSGHINITES